MKALPKLSAANQVALTLWQSRLAKAKSAEGKRKSATDNHAELATRLTAEIQTLEDEADPDDLKAIALLSEKRAQLSIVSRRIESGEAAEDAFVRSGKLHSALGGLEDVLHGIMHPVFELQLGEVAAAYRPFFLDDAGAMASARQALVINAWACWFRNVSTCCTLAGKGEVESLLQSITAILAGRLPFQFDNGLGNAAKPEAD